MNTGYRRAALALHGLGPEDKNWILSELPEHDRAALESLLDELGELGFEAGVSHDQSALITEPVQPSSRYRVATASVDQIVAALNGEPAALIAQLIRMERWPWSDAMMAQFAPARRMAVDMALQQVRVAPARDQRLLDLLARAIGPAPVATTTSDVPPRSGLIARMTAWIR